MTEPHGATRRGHDWPAPGLAGQRPGQRIDTARRQFLESGQVGEGMVSAAILRSWQRCAARGLDLTAAPSLEPMTAAELRQVRDRHEALRRLCAPELATLRQEASDAEAVIALTDPDGVILDIQGNPGFAHRAGRVALSPGVTWAEGLSGTNAIGTALTEGQPVVVHGAEHFFDPHRILSCAAAPIRDPRGGVIGGLDLSGPAALVPVHALSLVRLAVDQIERRQFETGFEQCRLVRLHRDSSLLGTAREGILVFSPDGRLIAANRHGLIGLGLEWDAVDSARFSDLFADRWAGGAGESPVALRDGQGRAFAALLRDPVRAARPSPSRGTAPAGPAPAGPAHRRGPEPIFDAETAAALQRAVRLLDADVPVLVQGETGCGKEVFACQMHARSGRRDRPLVAINCAALPEGLIEAELFGYEDGAFTGARRQGAKGLLRQADGGVLFLDEIGDMPLALQGRLLRVLQEKEVTPLGSGSPVAVDFALVCATHRPLRDLVEAGSFRADLYFRIAQYGVMLTPLRARPERATLIRTLWRSLGGGDIGAELSPDSLACLERYDWPGNFRQLTATLRGLLVLAEPGEPLGIEALPEDIRAPRSASNPTGIAKAAQSPAASTLDALTLETMRAAVAAHDGNFSRAAKQLGVNRSTLYRRLVWAEGRG